MPAVNDFDFSEIRYDSDLMQVVSVSCKNQDLVLPLTKGPVNFAVARSDGKLSNRWGAYVGSKGDAYVYCRDNPNAEKVSLHASGRQHISLTGEFAQGAGVEDRFGNVWSEPEFATEAVATFSLLFPTWGVGLDTAAALKASKKDQLLIVGHKEKMVVVAFFVVDTDRETQGSFPHIVLGRLLLRERKILHIVAFKEPQDGLRRLVEKTLPEIAQTLTNHEIADTDLTLNLQGYRQPNSAYMVSLPVRYTPTRRHVG